MLKSPFELVVCIEKTRQLSQMVLGTDATKYLCCNLCFGVLNFQPSLIFECINNYSTFTTMSDLCGYLVVYLSYL